MHHPVGVLHAGGSGHGRTRARESASTVAALRSASRCLEIFRCQESCREVERYESVAGSRCQRSLACVWFGSRRVVHRRLRANQLGVPIALAPILWALLNFVKSATGTYGGQLSDTIGRKPLIVGGWLLYAAVYFAFGLAGAPWQAWALFAVYGIFYGMTEGTEFAP